MKPAKAARMRRKAEERRSDQRKRWWALAVLVFIIAAMFVGLGILERRSRVSDEHRDGGAGTE